MLAIIGGVISAVAGIALLMLAEVGIIMCRLRDFVLGSICLLIAVSGIAGISYLYFG